MLASTPPPPYYAVIFSNVKSADTEGYSEMAERMVKLAAEQPGFLGIESASSDVAITVSYWESEQAITNWKRNAEHQVAQKLGKSKWYSAFQLRVAKVERAYGF